MNAYLTVALCLCALAVSAEGVMVTVEGFKFSLDSVKKMNGLQKAVPAFADPRAQRSRAAPECTDPELPAEFVPLCTNPRAPQLFEQLGTQQSFGLEAGLERRIMVIFIALMMLLVVAHTCNAQGPIQVTDTGLLDFGKDHPTIPVLLQLEGRLPPTLSLTSAPMNSGQDEDISVSLEFVKKLKEHLGKGSRSAPPHLSWKAVFITLCSDSELPEDSRLICDMDNGTRALQRLECKTNWFDRDDPSGTGDWELLSDLWNEKPGESCHQPLALEVQTLDGTPASETGQQFAVNEPITGFACINDQQGKGVFCLDFKVRFTCPESFCTRPQPQVTSRPRSTISSTPQPEPQQTATEQSPKGEPESQVTQVSGPKTTSPPIQTPQPQPQQTTTEQNQKGEPQPQVIFIPKTTSPPAQTPQHESQQTTSEESQKGGPQPQVTSRPRTTVPPAKTPNPEPQQTTNEQKGGPQPQATFRAKTTLPPIQTPQPEPQQSTSEHGQKGGQATLPVTFTTGKDQSGLEPVATTPTEPGPVQTARRTTTQVCKTKWINRDNPLAFGDYELIYYIRKRNPKAICKKPLAIEVQTVSGIPASQTGQIFAVNDVTNGFACVNTQQRNGTNCHDYKVRFTCPDSFCTGLAEMYQEEMLCDATLIVDGQRFPCHRALLAAVSPYFRDVFIHTWKKSNGGEVLLQDIAPSVIQSILKYIYTEEIALTPEQAPRIFAGACQLQIIPLQDTCCRFLMKNLSVQNCFGMYSLACTHRSQALLRATTDLLTRSFGLLFEDDDFLQLDTDTLITLVSSDDLAVAAEEQAELQRDLEGWGDLQLKWQEVDGEERLRLARGLRGGMYKPHVLCIDTQLCDFQELETEEAHMSCYEPQAESWEKLPGLPFLTHTCCAAAGDKVYVSGGVCRNIYSSAVYEFSAFTGHWVPLPSMTTPRAAHGFLFWDRTLFAVGGWRKFQNFLSSAESLDLETGQWAAMPKLPFALSHPASSVFRNKLYLLGGATGLSTHWLFHRGLLIYEISSSAWTQLPLSAGFFAAGAVALENGICVFGGYSEKKSRDWVEGTLAPENRYSTRKCFFVNEAGRVNHGISIPKLPRGIANAGVAYCDKRIYVLGGEDLTQRYKLIYHWAPGEPRWHRVTTEIPGSREGISRFGCATLMRPKPHILQLFQHTARVVVAAVRV
ncbi:hypothetical protein lerEdw1_019700 [Lerista edwardsae]|nr:hypothetical protein lerEdw1_019700 [Lerista edwardsae]